MIVSALELELYLCTFCERFEVVRHRQYKIMADLLNRKCAVLGCGGTGADGKTKLFSLPQGSSARQKWRRQEWMKFAGLTKEKKVYLCFRHFKDNSFRDKERRYLVYGALPSKNPAVASEMEAKTKVKEEVDVLEEDTSDVKGFALDSGRIFQNDAAASLYNFEMDNKIYMKEFGILDTGLPNKEDHCCIGPEGNYGDDVTARSNHFEMDHNISIKEEVNFLEAALPNERICFPTDFVNEAVAFDSDFELNDTRGSKEETFFSHISFQNGGKCFASDFVNKIKDENDEASVGETECQSEVLDSGFVAAE